MSGWLFLAAMANFLLALLVGGVLYISASSVVLFITYVVVGYHELSNKSVRADTF